MFGKFNMLIVLLIGLAEALPRTATTNGDHDFISIQKELPDANLYRKTGHWIMRATSDQSYKLTRVQFTLENDQVLEHHYVGLKRIFSGVVSHIKDNKALQSVSSDDQLRRIVTLYQDDRVIVMMIVTINQNVLVVLVKSCQTPHIDDHFIRNLISQKVLNKPNIRVVVEDLVNRLVFVNQNQPNVYYELEDPAFDINVAESDRVDSDMSKAVGNWMIKGFTGEFYKYVTFGSAHLNGDQLIIHLDSTNGKNSTLVLNYVGNTRGVRAHIYGYQYHTYAYGYFPYVDDDQFVAYGKLHNGEGHLAIYCRIGSKCNTNYLKGVIDNQLLFTSDVKRNIKDLVPTLSWR